MATLAPPPPPTQPAPQPVATRAAVGFGKIRGLLVLGSGLFGGGTILFALLDLFKSEPVKSFDLLRSWGPGFFLAMLVTGALYAVTTKGFETFERVGGRFADALDAIAGKQDRLAASQERLATSQEQIADASKATAAAAQQQADKDSRETERLSTLIEYAAQQSRQSLEQSRTNGTLLEKIAAQLEAK